MFEISVLSLAASVIYLVVIIACIAAAIEAQKKRQIVWGSKLWLTIASVFLLLICLRLTGFEDWARDLARQLLNANKSYDLRRDWQGPIIAFLILALAFATFFGSKLIAKRVVGRRALAGAIAGMSAFLMLGLVGLRLISLHAFDTLLYGPLKLNWIADVGLSITVLSCAIYYIRLLRTLR